MAVKILFGIECVALVLIGYAGIFTDWLDQYKGDYDERAGMDRMN